jgi:hypothetical protein
MEGIQVHEHGSCLAASAALRHSDISVTREHYVDQKPVGSVGLGHLLPRPDNVLVIPEETSGSG